MTTFNPQRWHYHIWRNRLQALLLLCMMGSFLALLGWLLWDVQGLWILLGAGLVLLLFQPLVSPRHIMHVYGARPLQPQQAPGLQRILLELSERAGLRSLPALYYLPSPAINAFTVGKQHNAVIALSDGLLQRLDTRELLGVLAHEISHIRSNDMRVMALADAIARLTSVFSLFGQLLLLLNLPLLLLLEEATINWWAILLLIFAPHLSVLAQLGLSRSREYHADLYAARLSGDAIGLAQALVKIERLQGGWMERMLFPLRRLPLPSLLRTHPATDERVRRLLALHETEPMDEWARGVQITPLVLPGDRLRPRWHRSRWWY